MDKKTEMELIMKGREFMKGFQTSDPYLETYESDQDKKLQQPPLVKAPMRGKEAQIVLPQEFDQQIKKSGLMETLRDRRSSRVYTQEEITLEQLSFLLWATQGIKGIRGKSYATLRTVPCGGARHEYETYLIIRKVKGLQPGVYHYLPMGHLLEFLKPVENIEDVITESLSGQKWASKASVVFFWAMTAYRAEWRYGIYAHRTALIDAGHIGENLYLACTGIGLGTCGIAAFAHDFCCQLFEIDGNEEYVVYTAPVGTIRPEDQAEEKAFYSFVDEAGL